MRAEYADITALHLLVRPKGSILEMVSGRTVLSINVATWSDIEKSRPSLALNPWDPADVMLSYFTSAADQIFDRTNVISSIVCHCNIVSV